MAATAREQALDRVAEDVSACTICPRLLAWREAVAADPPKRFKGEDYWARGVPAFGDPGASIALVGLAPAAHGANRTGRMWLAIAPATGSTQRLVSCRARGEPDDLCQP